MSSNTPSGKNHDDFVRALTRYERVVRAYIRGAGVSRPEDVDEVMQEVSLTAWNKFGQLDDLEHFPKWACVIARYKVLEFRRQKFRDRLVLNDSVFEMLMDEALEETGEKEACLRHLEGCLETMPQAGKKLLLAAYEPGTSIDALASTQGKQANALYQQLWRLRKLLAKCVESEMKADPNLPNPSAT